MTTDHVGQTLVQSVGEQLGDKIIHCGVGLHLMIIFKFIQSTNYFQLIISFPEPMVTSNCLFCLKPKFDIHIVKQTKADIIKVEGSGGTLRGP